MTTAVAKKKVMERVVFDLGRGELRDLNERLHGLTEEEAGTAWRILHP